MLPLSYRYYLDDSFNIDEISLQDRFNLLISIRKITKGNEFVFHINCPKCETELIVNIEIDELEDKPYPSSIEPKIELTDNMSVDLAMITRGMQKQAVSLVKKQKGLTDDQKVAEIATNVYALGMIAFDTPAGQISDASIDDKRDLLDNLSESVYVKINEWYDRYNYGIEFKYSKQCVSCDWETVDTDIPLSGFFF